MGSISARERGSRRRQPGLSAGLAATQVLLQRFRQYAAPVILNAELLRTSHQSPEEAADSPQGRDHHPPMPVARRRRQPRLTRMLGPPGNPVQQKRPLTFRYSAKKAR